MKRIIPLISAMIICFIMSVATPCVFAQVAEGQRYSVSSWWQATPFKFSPVVASNGNVTFRITAPQADSVALILGEWDIHPAPMEKDSTGIWSITVDTIKPAIYSYYFNVDGINVPDWHNPVVKTGTQLYSNILDVPGRDGRRFDETGEGPYGALHKLKYVSTPQKKVRGVRIYLPPQYHTQPKRSFPVLYLRHGGGDDEASWSSPAGQAHIILENLVNAQKAVPMIVVMTNGMTDGTWAGGSSKEAMEILEEELLMDVIPLVEQTYRTKPGKENRAIAGLSMGGGQAYVMGLRNLDKFSWIGEFSSGLLSDTSFDINERAPDILEHPAKINDQLYVLWIGCGKDDDRYQGHLAFHSDLMTRGINHVFWAEEGGHEWSVWRTQLFEFYQLLFK